MNENGESPESKEKGSFIPKIEREQKPQKLFQPLHFHAHPPQSPPSPTPPRLFLPLETKKMKLFFFIGFDVRILLFLTLAPLFFSQQINDVPLVAAHGHGNNEPTPSPTSSENVYPTSHSTSAPSPSDSISLSLSSSSSSPSPKFESLEAVITLTDILNDHSVPDDIAKSCKETMYPSECEASILALGAGKHDFEHHNPVTLFTLSCQALDQALETAKESISKPKSSSPAGGDVDESASEVCLEMYNEASQELKTVGEAIKESDKGSANAKLSAIVTEIDTCEDGLSEMQAEASRLASANKVLAKLAAIVLDLGSSAFKLDNQNEGEN